MSQKITKAIFPVAGLGTRFLPATKANPKEMLPIVDKPLVQFAAEEAIAAGIKELIFITGRQKRAIPDHFDKVFELEAKLERENHNDRLSLVRDIIPDDVTCVYIRQHEALGLGHAVYCARPVVGNEPFAVILADDLICSENKGCIGQMIEQYEAHGSSLLAVENVPREDVGRYGIVSPDTSKPHNNERLHYVKSIVEKPGVDEAPSTLGVVGRYILTPAIFDILKQTGRGLGGEIQLTDAIAELLRHEDVLAYEYEGKRYDCGSKLGYLQATVELGLKHHEVGDAFREYLASLAHDISA
jgi:UTP--glucose-1-phosphate uridylyltransferase